MTLELDERQRAMLLEMGVRVWLPGTAFAQSTGDAHAPHGATESVVPPSRMPAAAPVRGTAPAHVPAPAQTPVAAIEAPQFDGVTDWPALEQAVVACRACAACGDRKHPAMQVPAQTQADWMVVGDPPDEDEDALGTPFAGTSGELLGNMLHALQLVRVNPLPVQGAAPARAQAVYVTSVMKCRNARGAVPKAQDLAQCSAFLRQEIALVQPRIILAMGRFANQVLLAAQPELATAPLGKVRGSVHSFGGVPVVVTYHPKALLRNTQDKAKAWADLCLAADTVESSNADLTP